MAAGLASNPIATDLSLEAASTARRTSGSRGFRIVRRLAIMVLTLWVVSVIVFVATQILPGDAATSILGRNATPERVHALQEQLHLDRSGFAQYLSWLGGAAHGDFGTSVAANEPVLTFLGTRIINTSLLVLFAFAITIPLSLFLGIVAAVRRDRSTDHGISAGALVLNAVPDFVVALTLVVLFATSVSSVLPAVSLIPQGSNPLASLDAFVLPVATLVIVDVPYLVRLVRASMIDVLESEYVQLARLKGLPEREVLLRHALPNALVPMIQGSAQVLAYMAGGIVVVEYVFSFPGLGGALVSALNNRDIPVVQAATLFLAAFYVIANLVADLLTVLVTPRLRTANR